jgi:hypothetical protein
MKNYKNYAGNVGFACQQIDLKKIELMEKVTEESKNAEKQEDVRVRVDMRATSRLEAKSELIEFAKKTCKTFDVSFDFVCKITNLKASFS